MIKMLKVTSCVVAGFFLGTTALAADETKLNNFSAGISGLFQDNQNSVSPLVRWSPEYSFNDEISAGVSADFARQKFDDDTNFNAINLLANVNYKVSTNWTLGLSAGTELRDCSGCDSEAVFGLSVHRTLPYEAIGIKGQSVFIQALSIATDPTTTGAIAGTQFGF